MYDIICYYLFFLFFFSVARVSGVRIKTLDIPEMAQAGQDVHLLCDYDLERARLYQVIDQNYFRQMCVEINLFIYSFFMCA